MASQDMESIQTFDAAESFIQRIIARKKNFIILASQFKKLQHLYVIQKVENTDGDQASFLPKITEVHLLNQDV